MKIPGLTEIINRLLADIYDSLKDGFTQIVSNQLLEYQILLYSNSIKQKTLLAPNESVYIEDFYVPLFIRPYQTYGYKSVERINTNSVTHLFRQADNLLIFGYAGSGKSTLVKKMILSAIDEKYKFPILIELRNVHGLLDSFNQYVFESIFKFHKLGINEEIIERLLFTGNFLFILDGFDEIKDSEKLLIGTSIKDFIRKFRKNNFVITSRHYEALNSLENFKTYEVCEFIESERNLFIKKQIDVIKFKSEISDEMIAELSKNKNYSIRQYLNNPLLLSLFIITYITKKEVPFNKSEFYYNIFDSLFHRLDRLLKTDYVHEKISGLSKDEFMTILGCFSFFSFFNQQYEFTIQYFEQTIQNIKDIKEFNFETQNLLNDLILNINILVEEGTLLKFPHRSLQEYFAAYFITKLDHEEKKDFYSKLIYHTNDIFFISILLELDYLNAVEYFVIPLVDSFITNKVFEFQQQYDEVRLSENEVFDLIQNIFDSNENLKTIMTHFQDETPSSRRNNNEHLELIDWNRYKAIVFIENFKRNGIHLKRSLLKYIANVKSQDKKLIGMLKSSR